MLGSKGCCRARLEYQSRIDSEMCLITSAPTSPVTPETGPAHGPTASAPPKQAPSPAMQRGRTLPGSASSRLSSILTSCRHGMFRSYSWVNRAPRRSFSAAERDVRRGGRHLPRPVTAERRQNGYRWMPSQPIATWIMPCSSRKVQVSGTRRRRHTMGLIPSSQTLTCTTPAASATGGAASGPAAGFGCFERRGTSQPYRACPYAVAGITHFLMVPISAVCRLCRKQPFVQLLRLRCSLTF